MWLHMRMPNIIDVVDEAKIFEILKQTKIILPERIEEILEKAALQKGLTLEEIGALVNTDDPGLIEKMFETARGIKESIYGERLVFFAPLYISSFCVNDC